MYQTSCHLQVINVLSQLCGIQQTDSSDHRGNYWRQRQELVQALTYETRFVSFYLLYIYDIKRKTSNKHILHLSMYNKF